MSKALERLVEWDAQAQAMSDFRLGYLAAMRDLAGHHGTALGSWGRIAIVWDDPEGAARKSFHGPSWLDERVREIEEAHNLEAASKPKVKPTSKMGTVYVLHDPTRQRVKIGWTGGDVAGRQNSIERGAGIHLKLLLAMPGTRVDEGNAHVELHAARQHGEWFKFTKQVERWVMSKQRAQEGLAA